MLDDSATMLAAGGVADAALSGLMQPRKTLPAKLFYDDEGCRLFARITELPEYYPTRTERVLLDRVAPLVAATIQAPAVLVEYGASDEAKAEFLLRTSVFTAYVPIDVAAPQLEQMRARLRRCRPELFVCAVPADFMDVVALPTAVPALPRLGFFPGSTIGNLDPAEARRFLQRAQAALGDQSSFLVGVDLRKDPAILVPAYDDSQGVTAAFNRNLLARLNREAAADFDLNSFAHRAVWNDEASRIEMHLVSLRDQQVRVAGQAIRFAAGETIHTENSYKYSPERFAALAHEAGWHTAELWTDPARLFSLHLLEQRRGP
ncbi:MAG TPA: L-histidine N(alpha)-methyltransferase [Acetobacteraceae bacterium]|jgi:L-histidine N-alpha-methyltransferase|nr:L-histidine N(alpha)-methyltransferase [Acetobacteraceae bacterium]